MITATTPALLLAALLAIFPHTPARACLEARRDVIVQQLETAAAAYQVPPEILLAVAMHETHVGCDAGEGGGWGAPLDARHRHVAGTPGSAARVLARSYRVCRSWRGAVTRFRSGTCTTDPRRTRYVDSVMRLAARIRAIASR